MSLDHCLLSGQIIFSVSPQPGLDKKEKQPTLCQHTVSKPNQHIWFLQENKIRFQFLNKPLFESLLWNVVFLSCIVTASLREMNHLRHVMLSAAAYLQLNPNFF